MAAGATGIPADRTACAVPEPLRFPMEAHLKRAAAFGKKAARLSERT